MMSILLEAIVGGKLRRTNNFIGGSKEYKNCTNLFSQKILNLSNLGSRELEKGTNFSKPKNSNSRNWVGHHFTSPPTLVNFL